MKKKIIFIVIISMFLLTSISALSVNAYTNIAKSYNCNGILKIDDDGGPDIDYNSIQDAIDNEDLSDYYSIEVYPGTYFGNIVFEDYGDYWPKFDVIDKENTWIIGDAPGNVITVLNNAVSIELDGFKIKSHYSSGNGIVSEGTVTLKNCRIENIGGTGVNIGTGNIENCVVTGCSGSGIVLTHVYKVVIKNNIIKDNKEFGLKIFGHGTISQELPEAKIHHNDFINNGENAFDGLTSIDFSSFQIIPIAGEWDDGEVGNFWSDYTGEGDSPYILTDPDPPEQDLDRYPSVKPFNFDNNRPNKPTIIGPSTGKIKEELELTLFSTDADGEKISYYINWGDGASEESKQIESGQEYIAYHSWNSAGDKKIQVTAIDENGIHSPISDPFVITMSKNKATNKPLLRLFDLFTNVFSLFKQLLK